MVVTSFHFGRRHLSHRQWKVLHRCGVYFLWACAFSVYWWNVFYYPDAERLDVVFYGLGFLAFALRIAAWGKSRRQTASGPVSPAHNGGGALLVLLGLLASATGDRWYDAVSSFLLTPAWSANMELWLPFWPLEPFIPLLTIGLGVWLVSGAFQLPDPAVEAARA